MFGCLDFWLLGRWAFGSVDFLDWGPLGTRRKREGNVGNAAGGDLLGRSKATGGIAGGGINLGQTSHTLVTPAGVTGY